MELVEGSNLTRVFVQDTVLDFPRLNVITRDNASVYIDSVLSFKVVNPKLMLYSCVNLQAMLSKLLQVRRHWHASPCNQRHAARFALQPASRRTLCPATSFTPLPSEYAAQLSQQHRRGPAGGGRGGAERAYRAHGRAGAAPLSRQKNKTVETYAPS